MTPRDLLRLVHVIINSNRGFVDFDLVGGSVFLRSIVEVLNLLKSVDVY